MLSIKGKIAELTLQWHSPEVPYLSFTKTFQFRLDESVWTAKQAVLMEFGKMNLADPLNFGFYLPPHNGRAGKFLDEERPLKDYPMTKDQPVLEFRYKRKIFRGIHVEEKKLLKLNSKSQQRKFFDLVIANNVEKITGLLEKGIDPNFQDEKNGETPLTLAVASTDSIELIKLLVGNGAHIDFRTSEGHTALHKAAILGKSEALKTLLDLGASPNCKDAKGLTPLYHTILEGSDSYCAELLLSDYAITGVVDHQGIQEVHQACKKGRVQHLEFLLYYGVDVNARTPSGNTSLHICALSNQEECVKLLLCRGAERNLANYSNQSAYEVAILAGNSEIAQLIKEFEDSDRQNFSTSPHYINRGRGPRVVAQARSFDNLLEPPSPFLKRASSDSNMDSKVLRVAPSESAYSLPDHRSGKDTQWRCESDESETDESESDDETATIQRRTFSNGGVGTQRAPAPIKAAPGSSAHLKNRYYNSIQGKHFIAMTDYQPNAPGELAFKKGEQVEVLYDGEQGFWEGRVGNRTGWFPSCCVQEIKKRKKGRPKTWFATKKGSSLEQMEKPKSCEMPVARKITLRRNEKGFGFQLRGANSHAAQIDFTPTPQFPALQYIGEVDKGGVADKAGLKPGDFVLEVNDEDIVNASHGYAVNIISKGGKTLNLKIVTVAPELMNSDVRNSSSLPRERADSASRKSSTQKQPPPKPPVRSPYTCLTMGRIAGASIKEVYDPLASREETVMTLEKRSLIRKPSVESMWQQSAWKLQASDKFHQTEPVPQVVGRKDEILRGSGRLDKVRSLDVEHHVALRKDLIEIENKPSHRRNSLGKNSSEVASDIRPIGVNYPGYLTLPRKSSRKRETNNSDLQVGLRPRLSSLDSRHVGSSKDTRSALPPDYEHTMENLRKMGRKPSYTFNEGTNSTEEHCHMPRRNTEPAVIGELGKPSRRHEEEQQINTSEYEPRSAPQPTVAPTGRKPEIRASLVEGANYRTVPRSMSVPAPVPHPMVPRQYTERQFSGSHIPIPDESDEPKSEFAKSLANAVRKRESRVSQSSKDIDTIVKENRKISHDEAGGDSQTTTEIKVTLDCDESPKGTGRLSGAESLLQRRDSKGSDYFSLYTSSSTASLDSQCSKDSGIDTSLGLPNDTPPDHASALANAVAMRAARLAAKEMRDATECRKFTPNSEVGLSQTNHVSIEETSLVKPSIALQARKPDSRPKSGSFGSSTGPEVIFSAKPITKDCNDNVNNAHFRFEHDLKSPPPTKPKPSPEKRLLSQALGNRDSKLEAVPEDLRLPLCSSTSIGSRPPGFVGEKGSTYMIGVPNGNTHVTSQHLTEQALRMASTVNSQPSTMLSPPSTISQMTTQNLHMSTMTDEDLATMYLDEVITDVAATIDYDLVSLRSLHLGSPHLRHKNIPTIVQPLVAPQSSSPTEDVIIPPPPPQETLCEDLCNCESVPPPVMFLHDSAPSPSRETSPLPPPPDDFIDTSFGSREENALSSINLIQGAAVSDPPPPYSPPRSTGNLPDKLANKPYIDWNVDDVLCWLDYINMTEYKSAFQDNDIRGVHLPDLSKDDLAELGIRKLGHRMTVDDAIAKLCRTFTEV